MRSPAALALLACACLMGCDGDGAAQATDARAVDMADGIDAQADAEEHLAALNGPEWGYVARIDTTFGA